MFVTYMQTYKHTYIQTLWLLESLDLLDRETKNITDHLELIDLYNMTTHMTMFCGQQQFLIFCFSGKLYVPE